MATDFRREPTGGLLAQIQHYAHVILKWKWTAAGFFFAARSAAPASSLGGTPKRGSKPPDPSAPIFREILVRSFLGNIDVSLVERTQLVNVRFSNRNPKLATDILNALIDGYIDLIVRKRY